MRLLVVVATTLVAMPLLPAADFWTSSDPAQWSAQDIKKMVTDSPWAKHANVHLRGDTLAAVAAGTDRTMESAPATPQILVRWDSALPVCEACEKGGLERHFFSCASKLLYLSGLSKKFAELAKEFYIVSLSNYPKPPSPFQEEPQHSAAATAALERISQRIQQATFLKRNSKPPIKPAHVAALPAGHVLLVMVFFPRTEPLTPDDKEVAFESSNGTIDIKAKFNLRKMIYKGALEL